MTAVLTWLRETAWPWLKINWWVVLLAPLLFLPWLLGKLGAYMRGPTVIDPVVAADARARAEEATRDAASAEEARRRAEGLAEASTRHDEALAEVEAKAKTETGALREDPKALIEAMKRSVR